MAYRHKNVLEFVENEHRKCAARTSSLVAPILFEILRVIGAENDAATAAATATAADEHETDEEVF